MRHSFLSSVIAVLGAWVCLGLPFTVYAAAAPVFDADSLPATFGDNNGEAEVSTHDLPPSQTASAEEGKAGGGGFVPAAHPPTTQHAEAAPAGQAAAPQEVAQQDETAAAVDSLQGEVQTLRNQVEQLSHQLQQVQNEKSQAIEAGKPVSEAPIQSASAEPAVPPVMAEPEQLTSQDAVSARSVPVPSPVKDKKMAKASAAQPDPEAEQHLYETAYHLIKMKKYDRAAETFQDMLKQYPTGHFASNGHYWLGELFGLMGKHDLALNEFNTVITDFPKSARVSDAELKVGLIYSAQSNWSGARLAFEKVMHDFPNTASAQMAAEQLKQIKQS
jgi:tol-pal system protein YbgF